MYVYADVVHNIVLLTAYIVGVQVLWINLQKKTVLIYQLWLHTKHYTIACNIIYDLYNYFELNKLSTVQLVKVNLAYENC